MIVDIAPHIEQVLIQKAQAQGVSVADLITKWVQQDHETDHNAALAWEMGKDLFGTYHSGDGTLSQNAKSLVQKQIQEKYGKNSD